MIDSCSTQEELNMELDVGWKSFFSDDQRYADVINGFACGGCQVVKESDLQELDTQTGFLKAASFALSLRKTDAKGMTGKYLRSKQGRKIWLRDMIRKVAFGINFAIIGIENQEIIDYSLPLRNLAYDAGEYEKEGKVDMCRAITEWLAEEREAGIQTGIQRGIQTGIQKGIQTGIDDKTKNVVINMLKRGMSDEDIIAIAECTQELIDELR